MRAGKAYLSGLGTTGVLIASSLLLLVVVGAYFAYDSWPTSAVAESPVVAITGPDGGRAERAGNSIVLVVSARIERAAAKTTFTPPRSPAAAPAGPIEFGDATARAPVPGPGVSMVPATVSAPAPSVQEPARPAPTPPAAPPVVPAPPAPSSDLPTGPVVGGLVQGEGDEGGVATALEPVLGGSARARR